MCMSATERAVCPGCESELTKVEDRWVCQRPCGFETRAVTQAARVLFYHLCMNMRTAFKFVRQTDGALPGNNIMSDFKRFLDREEL